MQKGNALPRLTCLWPAGAQFGASTRQNLVRQVAGTAQDQELKVLLPCTEAGIIIGWDMHGPARAQF